jgi:aspartate/methionine/tyrosine aminotransferase
MGNIASQPEVLGDVTDTLLPFRTKTELIYEQLRRWIVAGRLGPGQRLDQEWLAAALRVSLMPLWQALSRLDEDREVVAQRVQVYQHLGDDTVRRINQLTVLEVTAPRATAFMFPQRLNRTLSDQEVALRLLHEARLLINPGYQFEERGAWQFWICFAQVERVWDGALDRMIGALS